MTKRKPPGERLKTGPKPRADARTAVLSVRVRPEVKAACDAAGAEAVSAALEAWVRERGTTGGEVGSG